MRNMITLWVVVAMLGVSSASTAYAGPLLESAAVKAALEMQPAGRATLGRSRMKVAVGLAVLAAGAVVMATAPRECREPHKYGDVCLNYTRDAFVEFTGGLIHTYDHDQLYVPTNPIVNDGEPFWLKRDFAKTVYSPREPELLGTGKLVMGVGIAAAAVGAYLIGWWAQPEELTLSILPGGVGVQKSIGF